MVFDIKHFKRILSINLLFSFLYTIYEALIIIPNDICLNDYLNINGNLNYQCIIFKHISQARLQTTSIKKIKICTI